MWNPDRRIKPVKFFGRRKGRSLSALQVNALESGQRIYKIDTTQPLTAGVESLFLNKQITDVRLEIGFGSGEHLLDCLALFPDIGFIGVEPFVNGMAKLMSSVVGSPAYNLRVYDKDARELLDWLPESSLIGIDLLYPDPWLKRRYWKRRFIDSENLTRMARVLKPGGLFRFVSDLEDYVIWTIQQCSDHGRFIQFTGNVFDEKEGPFAQWPGTRYEEKALQAGRSPFYLAFTNR